MLPRKTLAPQKHLINIKAMRLPTTIMNRWKMIKLS